MYRVPPWLPVSLREEVKVLTVPGRPPPHFLSAPLHPGFLTQWPLRFGHSRHACPRGSVCTPRYALPALRSASPQGCALPHALGRQRYLCSAGGRGSGRTCHRLRAGSCAHITLQPGPPFWPQEGEAGSPAFPPRTCSPLGWAFSPWSVGAWEPGALLGPQTSTACPRGFTGTTTGECRPFQSGLGRLPAHPALDPGWRPRGRSRALSAAGEAGVGG